MRTFSILPQCLAALLLCGAAQASTLEQQIDASISQLREIRAGASTEQINVYNKQMDSAWRLYNADKPNALPILRARLRQELAASQPSDLVLLDLGLFVHENDDEQGKVLARMALFRLDPKAEIIGANLQELFQFTYAVAKEHDPQVLGLISSYFLTTDGKVGVPQHAMVLDGTLICVFLYGAYGPEAEAALRAALSDQARSGRALEVLGWLGSPASVSEAGAALAAKPDYETLVRVVSYMMRQAGPAGREFVLGLDASRFDARSAAYLASIREAVSKTSYETYKTEIAKHVPDAPIFQPGAQRSELIARLEKKRTTDLHRISDEALGEVQIDNIMLNALHYQN